MVLKLKIKNQEILTQVHTNKSQVNNVLILLFSNKNNNNNNKEKEWMNSSLMLFLFQINQHNFNDINQKKLRQHTNIMICKLCAK